MKEYLKMKQYKWIGIVVSGLVAIALIGGISAFSFFNSASAKSSNFVPVNYAVSQTSFGPGFPGQRGANAQYLADALGITLEQLQAAQQKAYQAAIQQALDKGLITQAQADSLSQGGLRGEHGFDGFFLGPNSGIDMNALLANALGITTDKLQAAQTQALKAMLAQEVIDGRITQDQADLTIARNALGSSIDPQTLLAQALGISVDQLQTYRSQRKTMSDILTEVGKTPQEVLNSELADFEAAVQQGVTNNVITQAQANLVLTSRIGGFGFGPQGGFFDGMGGGKTRGFGRPAGPLNGGQNANPQTPNTSPTAAPSGTSF
jgi:hypothetical protein